MESNRKSHRKRWGICLLLGILSTVIINVILYFKIGEHYSTNAAGLFLLLIGITLLYYILFEGICYIRVWASNEVSLHYLIKAGIICEGAALICLVAIILPISFEVVATAEVITQALICIMAVLAVVAEVKLKDKRFLVFEAASVASTLSIFWLMFLQGTMS